MEFDRLAEGINATAHSLKALMQEMERKNQEEMKTAQAVQRPVLPTVSGLYADSDVSGKGRSFVIFSVHFLTNGV